MDIAKIKYIHYIMHYTTSILLIILLVFILFNNIEGLSLTVYDWNKPSFDKPKTEEVQVERKNMLPTGYSTIPMMDATPIDLESVKKMFETNINSNTNAAILDQLDDIESKLSISTSDYSCININGASNRANMETYNCSQENKVLNYNNLEEKCDSLGCSTDTCCSNRPQTITHAMYINNQCFQISDPDTDIENIENIYDNEGTCIKKNMKCHELPDLFSTDQAYSAWTTDLLCGDATERKWNPKSNTCNADELSSAEADPDQPSSLDCHLKCCTPP